MAVDLVAGLGIFKSMYDSAKALKDINDATVRNTAVIELQETILAAHAAQSALSHCVRELEEEVARFEAWNAEKEKYELVEITAGSFAFALKPEAQRPEPAHYICAACYEHRKRSILQRKPESDTSRGLGNPPLYRCPECKMETLAAEGR